MALFFTLDKDLQLFLPVVSVEPIVIITTLYRIIGHNRFSLSWKTINMQGNKSRRLGDAEHDAAGVTHDCEGRRV